MQLPILLALVLTSIATVSAAADGDDPAGDRWFSATFGTAGPGLETGIRLDPHWAVRMGVNGSELSFLYHDTQSDLHSSLQLFSAGPTLDYYPMAADFRLSGGLRWSKNRLTGRVKNLTGTIKGPDRDITLTVLDPLTRYKITQNPVQPYIGAGYDWEIRKNVVLRFDFGALYAGTPELDVHSHADFYGFTKRQIRREIRRSERRIEPFQVLPVAQVGLSFRF